jgi:hypothetical protein
MTRNLIDIVQSSLPVGYTGSQGTANLTVGTTAITSGTSGRVLYDNAGSLGEYATTGTAGNVVLSGAPTFTGTPQAPQFNATNGIYVNSLTIATSYSIPSGSSGMSAGPVSISGGVSVTVPAGSKWVVL